MVGRTCNNQRKDVAKYFIEKGIDVNLETTDGEKAIDVCDQSLKDELFPTKGSSAVPVKSWWSRLLAVFLNLCEYCLQQVEELPEAVEDAGKKIIDKKRSFWR